MFNEMQVAGSGGGIDEHLIEVGLSHTMNSTSISRTVSVDGVQVVNDTISATSQGNDFNSSVTFTVLGISITWKAYHTGQNPYIQNDFTIDGATVSFSQLASSSLSPSNNLTNPYDWKCSLSLINNYLYMKL